MGASTSTIIAQMLFLEAQDPDKDIQLYINSPGGPVTDIQIVTEQMQKTKQRLTRILSENTGKSFAEVAADTERDNYMSAQEALAYGLIDKIIDKR
jgi:ATP-dependent Clp protease protease subunit